MSYDCQGPCTHCKDCLCPSWAAREDLTPEQISVLTTACPVHGTGVKS